MEETELTSRYFGSAKACTSVTGMWPFEGGKLRFVKRIILYILFSTAVTTQECPRELVGLITDRCVACLVAVCNEMMIYCFRLQVARIVVFYSFDTMVEEVPFVCVALAAIVKHINFILNAPKFADLLKDVTEYWRSEKTDEEAAIMHTYAERALLYSLLYKLNIWLMCALFSCMPLLPRIMDAVRPLNESRQRLYIYPAYYFVDSDTYYHYIIGHTFLCLLEVATIFAGTDMIMIYLVQHACGLLITAGCRFKQTADTTSVSSKEYISLSDTKYRKLCISIQSHNKAIQTLHSIESVYAISMFFQVGIVMVAFSITLVMVAVREFTIDLCLFYVFVVVQIIHILFLTIQGQFVINSHDALYRMIYEALWYEQSVKTQALYVLALRRCLTPPVLTAGGLIQLNLNSFAEIVKASVSYFTVLKSS